VAQLTAVSQTILRQLPPGTTPPLIIQYSASTVSILQFGISSAKLSEQQVFDIALNQIRVGLISVPGVSIPYPYGGMQRVVSVDLDLKALEANNLVESDVVTTISNGSLTYPSGTAKIGGKAAIERAGTFLDGIQQLPDDRADLVPSMARVTRTISNPKQKIRTLRRN